jgi:8-hydroxy-5-deazaflavin:NADPH oxidoreductase
VKIGVIGSGSVGGGLARLWAAKGHQVMLSFARDEAKLAQKAAAMGAQVGSPAEAVAFGEVVVFAPPWSTVREAITAAGSLDGKVLIDCTNNMSGEDLQTSGAEQIAALAPGAKVVKAFNTLFSALYEDIATAKERPDLVYCGDDADAKGLAAELIRDAGLEPVDAGALSAAGEVEALARLVIGIAYNQGRGPFTYRLSLNEGLRSPRS